MTYDPNRHAGKTYRPTGPELLFAQQMAVAVANALGHRVIPVPLPYSMFLKVARQQGVDPILASVFVRYVGGDMKAGVFEFEGGVTDDLERLTGEPARASKPPRAATRHCRSPARRRPTGSRRSSSSRRRHSCPATTCLG